MSESTVHQFTQETFDKFNNSRKIEHLSELDLLRYLSGNQIDDLVKLQLFYYKKQDLSLFVIRIIVESFRHLIKNIEPYGLPNSEIIFHLNGQNFHFKSDRADSNHRVEGSGFALFELADYIISEHMLKLICDQDIVELRLAGSRKSNDFTIKNINYFRQFYNDTIDKSAYLEKIKEPTPPFVAPTTNSGCFIATAAYGNFYHPHVVELRNFRDGFLLKTRFGEIFVSLYYKYSPYIALAVKRHKIVKYMAIWFLIKPALIFMRFLKK